jgi:type IV secretion system protein VirD4
MTHSLEIKPRGLLQRLKVSGISFGILMVTVWLAGNFPLPQWIQWQIIDSHEVSQLLGIRFLWDPIPALWSGLAFALTHHQVNALTSMWLVLGVGMSAILIHAGYYQAQAAQLQQQDVGQGRFATRTEIKTAHLVHNADPYAVFIGLKDGLWGQKQYLRDSSPSHVLVTAPSRSGKGVGLVIPTLLSYQGSVIVSDFKLENWQHTAGFRQSLHHRVLKFAPTLDDVTAARFNPLMEIRKGTVNEVRDVQLIADLLVDPDGKRQLDYWAQAAHSLLTTMIVHVLYTEDAPSLSSVRAALTDPTIHSETELFESLLNTIHCPLNPSGATTHPLVAQGAREMLNKNEAERSSIVSTALTYLRLFRDPLIQEHTSRHDFTIASLVSGNTPTSLYLGVPPSDIERTMPLMRLILQMIVARLTEQWSAELSTTRFPVLLLLDEFPQFGRLPFFERALAYAAGYHIRAYLIAQSIQQIHQCYGRDQSIEGNCAIRISYAPNTLESAQHLSQQLGETTHVRKQVNYSGQRMSMLLAHMNVSEQHLRRPLLSPQALLTLPDDRMLILKTGMPAILGRKLRYYEAPFFLKRAEMRVVDSALSITPHHPVQGINFDPTVVAHVQTDVACPPIISTTREPPALHIAKHSLERHNQRMPR